MPKLRRLTGIEVLTILELFGFEVIRIRGSHHRLRRIVEGQSQFLTVAVHGNKPIPIGTLRSIYRQALQYIPEEELAVHFQSEG